MQTGFVSEDQIAAIFVSARLLGLPLDNFPGPIPATLADAYRVQSLGMARMPGNVAGWKVGRILSPLSEQFECDRLAGPIFSAGIGLPSTAAPMVGRVFLGGFGAAEAELLLRLRAAPKKGQKKFSLDEVESLIDRVHVGIEIASSPLATINALGPPVIVSDFGNNNGLIVGPEVVEWRTSGMSDWVVVMLIDGVEVGRGSANAFPDGPVGSVRFLLELMADREMMLADGTWVSTGAITGVHDVRPGQHVEARFGHGLKTTCTIEAMPQQQRASEI